MSEDRAVQEWQGVLNTKQTVLKYRNAVVGDGAGNIDVIGEPGYIWCRYSSDQSKASKVFNILAPGLPEDFPVVVGRRFPESEFEEVLFVNWTLYKDVIDQDAVDNFNTGNHGESHNAADGVDPAPIDLRNIIEMRGRAQDVPDLTIFIERGQYIYGSDVKRFPSETVDLTASVPATSGYHRFVLVYVDAATNSAGTTDGTIVPPAITAPIPDLTENTIPICLVELFQAQTTIDEDNIYDWRFLWDVVSNQIIILTGTNADRLALTIATLAEFTRFYTSDTDKIWEVYESAWRLIYPPSALSTSDGDAGTPWSTDGSGQLTGTQTLIMDDGVGSSPSIDFVGGSNDDTIVVYLYDDAVAGDSDLVIALADDNGDSTLEIDNNSGIIKFEFHSDGQMTETRRTALTNTVADFQTLKHETTGTAAAGFGLRNLFQLEDAGGAMEDAAAITVTWENAGAAAEASIITFWLRKAGAVLGPFIEFGATEVVFNESSADIDFRVEGDGDTHAIFVRGSDDLVGIGQSNPGAKLHVLAANLCANFESGAGVNTNNFNFLHTGAPAANKVRWTYSVRSNDQDFLLFGYDGTTFQNYLFAYWGTHELNILANIFSTNSDASIGTRSVPTANGGKVLSFGDNTADPTMAANTAGLYGKDVAGTVEMFAIDEAGNTAQLTPHNFDGPVQPIAGTLHWSQYHRNPYLGVEKWYDIERALLALETLTGEQFIYTQSLPVLERSSWYREQARQGTRKPMPTWMKGA